MGASMQSPPTCDARLCFVLARASFRLRLGAARYGGCAGYSIIQEIYQSIWNTAYTYFLHICNIHFATSMPSPSSSNKRTWQRSAMMPFQYLPTCVCICLHKFLYLLSQCQYAYMIYTYIYIYNIKYYVYVIILNMLYILYTIII